jgi:tetratricopeptide (TPR) repeat protein
MAATGCAYFNGMYYANRYASQAEASERAGRIGEARDRWQQAQMHAESLLARHPESRWTGDAQLVRGRALVHLEAWSDAVIALAEAARRTAASPSRHVEALALLGRAYLALGMPEAARPMLDTAVDAPQPEIRDEALLIRGRLLVALDRPELARDDLRRSRDRRAPYDLAQVDLRLGDTAAAGALYDSLAATTTFPEEAWRQGLDSLAASGAGAHAARLVERLAVRAALPSGVRARVLLDDASRRLRSADTAAAAAEFERVVSLAPDSLSGQVAAVAVIRLGVAAAATDSDLEPLRERLMALVRTGGGAGREARDALRLMARLDTLAAAPTAADAFWFLRAELLRDSLRAGRLASSAFASMAATFPASPWTPKALVAAIAAGYPAPDSLRALLARRYGDSPYASVALGRTGAGDSAYAALEDSLQRVLAVAGAARAPAGPAPRRPGEVGDVDDQPGATRRPAPVAPAPRPAPRPAGPPRPEPPQ